MKAQCLYLQVLIQVMLTTKNTRHPFIDFSICEIEEPSVDKVRTSFDEQTRTVFIAIH